MNKSTELITKVFEYLNANVNYAVMRNYEHLPEFNNSRDIDIIITKNEYKRVQTDIVNIIISKGFLVTTYYTSRRMNTLVCVYYNDNNIEAVQFDFFFNTSLYGLVLLRAEDILADREFNGKVFYVSKMFEFLDKYLYLKGLGVEYPQKYEPIYRVIKQTDRIDTILQNNFGIKSLVELDSISSSKMIMKILIANTRRRPVYQLSNFIIDMYCSGLNFIYCKGISIGFTGPDGSGKTTVINFISEYLSKIYGDIKSFHFRPAVLSNIGDAAFNVGLSKNIDKEYCNPHRGVKTGLLSSLLRLLYYTIDYIIGYYQKVRRCLYIRSIVIFDRYYTDIITDSRRSRIFLNTKFLFYWGKLFIPRLKYNILLTANADVILARKQELDTKGVEDINLKLDYLATKKGYYLVKNNGTAEGAAIEILKIIFELQHAKNLKRI